MEVNKHGLSRYIPEAVAREVRQRCGFGCVICGSAICEYEHFDPVFSEAFEHSPDGIILLCGQHHTKKTRGWISDAAIRKSILQPYSKNNGFAWEEIEPTEFDPVITVGPISTSRCQDIILIDGKPIISVLPPEEKGAPFRLSVEMQDRHEQAIFSITDNIWRIRSGSWDAKVVQNGITIRSDMGEVALLARSKPNVGVDFERMHLRYGGHTIIANSRYLVVHLKTGDVLWTSRVDIDNFGQVVTIDSSGVALGTSRPIDFKNRMYIERGGTGWWPAKYSNKWKFPAKGLPYLPGVPNLGWIK